MRSTASATPTKSSLRSIAACRSRDPIALIASKCGYSDQSAFPRKFREAMGLSPAEYRKTFGTAAATDPTSRVVDAQRG